jgi:hypothetical protein
MDHDLTIDAGDIRECGSAVGRTGARVTGGSAAAPETVPPPQWATGAAAALAADGACRRLAEVGADIALAARQIVETVVEYEAADERTADRLRGAR